MCLYISIRAIDARLMRMSVWMIVLLPLLTQACTIQVESVNCTRKDISNLLLTCRSNPEQSDCACVFENPLRSELGWYKMCKTKGVLKLGKKKVRKRQISILDHCGRIQPPRPGKASCVVSPHEITCTGECNRGFKFRNGSKALSFSCNYSEGVWTPNATFPTCEPECIPACRNGGNCTAPNFCDCSNEYRGDNCQYALDRCEISKTLQASSWLCNHTRTETSCDISCHAPGTIEAETDVYRHVCSVDGKWVPPLPTCVEAVVRCEDPGVIDFGRRLHPITDFPVGSSISYECHEGFTLSGESEALCQSDGKWSAEKPTCEKLEGVTELCPKPHAPKNSIVRLSYPEQRPLQTFHVSEWSIEASMLQLYLTMRGNSSHGPGEEFNSLPEDMFIVGSRVQYKCRSRFYKLYGSEYQTCLSSRSWSGYQPACVPECGKSDSPKTPFVVNGEKSLVGQWPWIVGLAFKGSRGLQLICGGVLISETWVLTAAHCVTKRFSNTQMDPKNLLIFCGKYYRMLANDDEFVQVKKVKQIIVHDEYDFVHYDGDIALVQLESEVELTTRVQPICLPTEITTRENVRDGQKGLVLGWGLTENGNFSETLRETVLPVVSPEKCERAYREGLRTITITRNMFCAGHESGLSDTCTGDSGGPFMFSVGPDNDKRWYLEGIVSWGSEAGCGKANRYSGFTKVGRFVPWINMFI